jgi:hypothetical protein
MASQVTDGAGNPVPAGTLGKFIVKIPAAKPHKSQRTATAPRPHYASPR